RSAEHIICAFLAVLESVKDKMILVDQPELFGEMTITKRPADWNPNLADDYDAEYDEISKNHLEDEDNYSVVSEDSTE
ncbi:MAG: segregation/condensation protein A, partial [Spirochaetales bacterium]|nr:segregation/condensation protein A [Spirochaetales bacterium]